MPISRVIINSSPLITLFGSKQQYILPKLFDEIIVPEAVWQEIVEGGHQDLAAKAIPNTPWLLRKSQESISPLVMSWDLGKGETAVIGYANSYPDYHVILDDAAARRCAKALGIKSIGTLGVVLIAKQRGIISSVKPVLIALQDAGLWLGQDIISMVLQQAGEQE